MLNTKNAFETDVELQPESIAEALRFYEAQSYFEQIRDLAENRYDRIVLTGMGSSYAACINAGAMLRSAGLNVFTEVTSDLVHYHRGMITENTLLVMVSQSGHSGEIVELCESISETLPVVAVTNDGECALAKRAQLTLLMNVAPEQIVSTRTYVASQMLMYLFAKAFLGEPKDKVIGQLKESIAYLSKAVEEFSAVQDKMRAHIGVPSYVSLIGRGWSYATAEAGALFIKEGAKSPSIAFEAAQFRHGPIELVSEGFAALLFIPKGQCEQMQCRIAEEICSHGGKVVAVVEKGVELPRHPGILPIRQNYVSQELAVLVNIVAVQAYINYISKDCGYDSGSFRCGSKVTDIQ